jgi:hypothetical protein
MTQFSEALLERVTSTRRALGLQVRVTFEGRVPFNFYCKDVDHRDASVTRWRNRIGEVTEEGYTILSVEIVKE